MGSLPYCPPEALSGRFSEASDLYSLGVVLFEMVAGSRPFNAPDSEKLADAILRFFTLGTAYFLPALRTEKEKYSWPRLVETILTLHT